MPTDFSKCAVYRIDCDVTGKIYIGSTAQQLHHRWADHKKASLRPKNANIKLYKSFADHGLDHHHIELVESLSVENRSQLTAREGHWIRQFDTYKTGLNGCIAGRTMAEYKKTEEYKESQKKYNQTSEKYKEYQKTYEQTEKCKAYRKEYYEKKKAAKTDPTDPHIEQ